MDGFEATRKIRSISDFESLPIIAVTANISDVDRQRCSDSGMNDFMAKPVNTHLVADMLSKWTNQQKSA